MIEFKQRTICYLGVAKVRRRKESYEDVQDGLKL